MKREKPQEAQKNKTSSVVTKAFLKATESLEMSRTQVALLLGISEASLTRIFQGQRLIDLSTKEGEIATYFLRLYRSLDTLFGGNLENSMRWFHSQNSHLGGIPCELIQSIGGLIEVTGYLDAMRGKV